MIRNALSMLGLLLVSTSAAGAQVHVTLDAKRYSVGEQIHARVENIGSQPITICIEIGQRSFNKGVVEATPTPFVVQRNTSGKWSTLFIVPDVGEHQNPDVLEAAKSIEFPFRLRDTGTMRLRLNYWLGSTPNLNCWPLPRGVKRTASPTFTVN